MKTIKELYEALRPLREEEARIGGNLDLRMAQRMLVKSFVADNPDAFRAVRATRTQAEVAFRVFGTRNNGSVSCLENGNTFRFPTKDLLQLVQAYAEMESGEVPPVNTAAAERKLRSEKAAVLKALYRNLDLIFELAERAGVKQEVIERCKGAWNDATEIIM